MAGRQKRSQENPIEIQSSPMPAKPTEWLEETSVILRAWLRGIRMARGARFQSDERELTAFMIKELNYLCEHNYILYLVLTGEFGLLREFFLKEEREHAKILLFDILKSEHKVTQNQRQQTEAAALASNKVLDTNAAKAITPLDLVLFYERQRDRIHHEFHRERIELLNTTLNDLRANLRSTIDSVSNDPNVSDKVKKDMEAIILSVDKQQDKTASHNLDKSHEATKTRSEKLYKVYSDIIARTDQLYIKHAAFSNSHANNQLIKKSFSNRHEQIIEKRDIRLKENSPHLEKALSQAKIHQDLDKVLNALKKIDVNTLDEKQKLELNEFKRTFESYNLELLRARDYKTINAIFEKSFNKILQLENSPFISQEIFNSVRRNANNFSQSQANLVNSKISAIFDRSNNINNSFNSRINNQFQKENIERTCFYRQNLNGDRIDNQDFKKNIKELISEFEKIKEYISQDIDLEKWERYLKELKTFESSEEIPQNMLDKMLKDLTLSTSTENLQDIITVMLEEQQKTNSLRINF